MKIDADIFRSYDIRALYPTEFNEDIAYLVGRALVVYLNAETIVVGRDDRKSSPAIFNSFVNGILDQGADVVDIGLINTPMMYFASWKLGSCGSAMVTASHNPKEYNGIKMTSKNAQAIGKGTGMEEVRDLVLENDFKTPSQKGSKREEDILERYHEYFSSFYRAGDFTVEIAVDPGNGMGVHDIDTLMRLPDTITLHTIFDEIDGDFPNHPADPHQKETLTYLWKVLTDVQAHFGIALDGDGDRVAFLDENGDVISNDFLGALIGGYIAERNPGATILYDLRSSKIVPEYIRKYGGNPKEVRCGHSHIKRHMAEEDALFGMELTGHFFFKENHYAESTVLAVITILNIMKETSKTLSELIKPLRKYHHSGEIFNAVDDHASLINKLEKIYGHGQISRIDGLKVVFPDWWFNIRPSNTEPKVKMVIEADSLDLMKQNRDDIQTIIDETKIPVKIPTLV